MAEILQIIIEADVSRAQAALNAFAGDTVKVGESLKKISPIANSVGTSLDNVAKKSLAPIRTLQAGVSKLGDTLETLRAKSLAKQEFIKTERDVAKIAILNKEIQALEAEILRVQNIGKTGIAFNTSGVVAGANNAFTALRKLAFILPGIGIAGILGFATSTIANLIGIGDAAEDTAKKIKDLIKPIGDLRAEAIGGTEAELSKVQALTNVILDQTKSYKIRNRALGELKEINKGYFGDLTLEASSLAILKDRVKEYTQALVQQGIIKAFGDEIGKVNVELFKQRQHYADIKKAIGELSSVAGFVQKSINRQTNLELIQQSGIISKLEGQYTDLFGEIQKAVNESLKFKDLKTSVDTKGLEDAQKKLISIAKKIQSDFASLVPGDFRIFDEDSIKTQLAKAKEIIEGFKKGFGTQQELRLRLIPNIAIDTIDFKKIQIPEIVIPSPKIKILAPDFNIEGNIQQLRDKLIAQLSPEEFAKAFKKLSDEFAKGDFQTKLKVSVEFGDLEKVRELAKGALGGISKDTAEAAQLINDSLTPAFKDLFDAILEGKNPIEAFFNTIVKSVENVISKLIESQIQSAILGVIGATAKSTGVAIASTAIATKAAAGAGAGAAAAANAAAAGAAAAAVSAQASAAAAIAAAVAAKLAAASNPAFAFLGLFGGFAEGGRPPVGKPSLVGEKGMELFVPDKPGTILTHQETVSVLKEKLSNRNYASVSSESVKEINSIKEYLSNERIGRQLTEHLHTIEYKLFNTVYKISEQTNKIIERFETHTEAINKFVQSSTITNATYSRDAIQSITNVTSDRFKSIASTVVSNDQFREYADKISLVTDKDKKTLSELVSTIYKIDRSKDYKNDVTRLVSEISNSIKLVQSSNDIERVESSLRNENLSFNHHVEIAKLPQEKQIEFLTKVSEAVNNTYEKFSGSIISTVNNLKEHFSTISNSVQNNVERLEKITTSFVTDKSSTTNLSIIEKLISSNSQNISSLIKDNSVKETGFEKLISSFKQSDQSKLFNELQQSVNSYSTNEIEKVISSLKQSFTDSSIIDKIKEINNSATNKNFTTSFTEFHEASFKDHNSTADKFISSVSNQIERFYKDSFSEFVNSFSISSEKLKADSLKTSASDTAKYFTKESFQNKELLEKFVSDKLVIKAFDSNNILKYVSNSIKETLKTVGGEGSKSFRQLELFKETNSEKESSFIDKLHTSFTGKIDKLIDRLTTNSATDNRIINIEKIINNNFLSTETFNNSSIKSFSVEKFAKMFNIPAFASSGAVFGPTLAIIGEGFGISRSNPEFVGTLNQLKNVIGGSFGVDVNLSAELTTNDNAFMAKFFRIIRSQARTTGKNPFKP